MRNIFIPGYILFLLLISCNHGRVENVIKATNEGDSLIIDYSDSIEVEFMNYTLTPIPPINKGYSDRLRFKVTNLLSKDTMFFECIKDSFMYAYRLGYKRFINDKKVWITSSFNSLVYFDSGYNRKIYMNHILPKESKYLVCQFNQRLNREIYDSALVDVGFYIQDKEYVRKMIFKVPEK